MLIMIMMMDMDMLERIRIRIETHFGQKGGDMDVPEVLPHAPRHLHQHIPRGAEDDAGRGSERCDIISTRRVGGVGADGTRGAELRGELLEEGEQNRQAGRGAGDGVGDGKGERGEEDPSGGFLVLTIGHR